MNKQEIEEKEIIETYWYYVSSDSINTTSGICSTSDNDFPLADTLVRISKQAYTSIRNVFITYILKISKTEFEKMKTLTDMQTITTYWYANNKHHL